MAKSKDINLLEAMVGGANAGKHTWAKWVLIAFAAVVIVAAISAFSYFSTISELNDKSTELDRQLSSPTLLGAYQESISLKSTSESAQSKAGAIKSTLMGLSSYPKIYSKQIKKVRSYAGSSIELSGIKYDSTTGVLSFSAESSSLARFPRFVDKLRSSGIFADVQYRGYARAETNPINTVLPTDNTADETPVKPAKVITTYRYDLQCLVKAPAPKLPKVAGLDGGE